ncbi:MAG: entericidin A/B family lipoprotein [Sphingobium sp.]
MKKKPVLATALLSALVLLSACNTVEGAGRDVSSAGDAVSDAARDAR